MASAARWWREWEVWVVVLLAGLIYGTRLSDSLPSGEEPRKGQIAREMITSGDWIVPRQQGLPFLSRPPVQNWAIAAVALARGKVDAVAIRLPSVLALLLTTVLIYAYGRTFLSRLGALWAAAAYSTMGLVLQFGWLGETESLYTLVVAGSLLTWRWADATGRSPLLTWCAGYSLAALGMLTKGPQAPIYFLGGVGLFLLVMRRWRELFRWQHAAGIAVFLAIFLAWEIPFYLRVTPHEAWMMLTGDVAAHLNDSSWSRTVKHVFEFPLSVAACTLPWGVLLLAYFRRDFRRSIGFARTDVCFLAVSIGFAFLTCYVVPGARNRYFASMLPLCALLIGLAAQQCSVVAVSEAGTVPIFSGTIGHRRKALVGMVEKMGLSLLRPDRIWRHYFIGMGIVCAGLGMWFTAATVLRLGAFKGQQPPVFAAVFALAAAAVTTIAFWSSRRYSPVGERLGVLALAGFLGLTYCGAIVNIFVASWHPIDAEVAALAARIPADVELVSIGPVDDVFLYYYGRPIRRLPASEGLGRQERPWTWFCMGCGPTLPKFDPSYERLGTIALETAYSDHPHDVVIIGRRLSDATAGQPGGGSIR